MALSCQKYWEIQVRLMVCDYVYFSLGHEQTVETDQLLHNAVYLDDGLYKFG